MASGRGANEDEEEETDEEEDENAIREALLKSTTMNTPNTTTSTKNEKNYHLCYRRKAGESDVRVLVLYRVTARFVQDEQPIASLCAMRLMKYGRFSIHKVGIADIRTCLKRNDANTDEETSGRARENGRVDVLHVWTIFEL